MLLWCKAMQDNNAHLNVDLTFLDEKSGPTGTSAAVDTGYKTNWRNIAIIVGIVLVVGYLIFANNQPSSQGTAGNSSVSYEPQSPATSGGSTDTAPADQSQSPGTDSVTNGQFRCSSEDSAEADRLGPTESEQQLQSDKSALDARASQLEQLKGQIDADPTDENSSQADIDSHNEMIESYNTQLNSYKSDAASLQERMDAFNAAVEAHNNYLEQHCSRNVQ